MVGLKEETETLIKYLTVDTVELDVISIVGMTGQGKTTLARKVSEDPKIQKEFTSCIWVDVSQDYTTWNIFLAILDKIAKASVDKDNADYLANELTRLNKVILSKETESTEVRKLANLIQQQIEKEKYLIILDDIWTKEAWDNLQAAFPKKNTHSKILITSRYDTVAIYAKHKRDPVKLGFLNKSDSKTLLKLVAFHEEDCPKEYEPLVTEAAAICGGLPHALVVLGGSLRDNVKNNNSRRNVSEKISHLTENMNEVMKKYISSSYNNLSDQLKACFLYFGMLPQAFYIPVPELVYLWTAEGFIQQKEGGNQKLEQVAENFLDELISKNLVLAKKKAPDGRIKTCGVHEVVRDFCRNQAAKEEENLFRELKMSNEFELSSSDREQCRRLCIHSHVSKFLSSNPRYPHVRSFLYFPEERIVHEEDVSAISEAFKLLRVLDIKSIKLTKFPDDFTLMVHLRYIALSGNFKILPAAISKLWNMQTLIVHTTETTLQMEANIWKMIQLRHVKTNSSTILPAKSKSHGTLPKKKMKEEEGKRLQTISSISPESCTEDVTRASNLKKLGIRGQLSVLMESKGGSTRFDILQKLSNLENLKLINSPSHVPPSEDHLTSLPQGYRFPPNLRQLTLSATYLDWPHMSTLAQLGSLEVLKLKDNAFRGRSWDITDGCFGHLKVLYLGRTNLVSWTASSTSVFPALQCLVVRDCENLEVIPSSLADVPTLEIMDFRRTNSLAIDSAREIQGKRNKMQGLGSSRNSELKLTINSPDR